MENKTKKTPVEHPIHELIEKRWSPRMFADKEVHEGEIKQLLEAGRWAPSSMNSQPWRIIWGLRGDKVYQRIYDCLHEFNQQWADNAPALIISAYKSHRDDGKESFHALHDLGLFMGNFSLQATSMGLSLHQMAGIDPKKALEEFGFPEGYHVATATAIGYQGGDADELPGDLIADEQQEVRERRPQSEWAFNGDFDLR